MLGVLRMDIDTCINSYLDMAPDIFPEESRLSKTTLWQTKKAIASQNRFQAAPFETAIKRLVRDQLGDRASGDEMMRSQSSSGCKV